MKRALVIAIAGSMLAVPLNAALAERRDIIGSIGDFLAEALSSVHNWGTDRIVDKQVQDLIPKVDHDIPYAGNGGILIVARMQAIETDTGTYRKLIGSSVDYVGIGDTPAGAELAGIVKQRDRLQRLDAGYLNDFENSKAYWFKRSPSGQVVMTEVDFKLLRRGVLQLYSKRILDSYDWELARERELNRICEIYQKSVANESASREMQGLVKSREKALVERGEINKKLAEAMEQSRRAGANASVLGFLAQAISLAVMISTASEGMSATNSEAIANATTKEGILAELDAIQKRALSEIKELQLRAYQNHKLWLEIEFNILNRFRQDSVPIENLPDGTPPNVLP
ncbi:hypothetical protein G6L05_22115 [Agrobacterium rhizogenes]|nr:hypothetical protein [Rhizobium rhizogenes]